MIEQSRKFTVLYVCIDPTLGGSTASLFNLIESVKGEVDPIVLFPRKGVASDFFSTHGIESHVYPFIMLHKFQRNRLIDVWSHPWRWHPVKKWKSDSGCARFLQKALKGRKVDIIHTNTSPNDVGVYLSRFFRAKHVWHVRECLDDHDGFEMYGGRDRLIRKINGADARIAISSYVREHWKMKEGGTYLIHDAICSAKDTVYLPDKEKYVLLASYNLTEAKGARLAIQAFGKSRLFEDGYQLVLMGNCKDDYRSSIEAEAQNLGCDSDVVFLPCQNQVKPVIEKASALIMASRYEGLGRVTAEAMFYGCPVIAHASGGTLDLVQDGRTGYLFHDVDECAALLRKVCLNDQETVILHAQHYAVEELSTEVYGPRILSVYHSVVQ